MDAAPRTTPPVPRATPILLHFNFLPNRKETNHHRLAQSPPARPATVEQQHMIRCPGLCCSEWLAVQMHFREPVSYSPLLPTRPLHTALLWAAGCGTADWREREQTGIFYYDAASAGENSSTTPKSKYRTPSHSSLTGRSPPKGSEVTSKPSACGPAPPAVDSGRRGKRRRFDPLVV